jgi:putative transposase
LKKTYQYRIYPKKDTTNKTLIALELCRQIYNLALEQKIYAYRQRKVSLTCYDQIYQLPELKKKFPEYNQVPSQSLQDVCQRVDRAFKNFFRRNKEGLSKGFPRFKGFGRYDSITLKQAGWKIESNYLVVKKFGKFKVRFHRSIPKEAKIKTVTIRRTLTNKWFVSFSCDNITSNILPKSNEIIGLDVGCESFLTDSNGLKVENPRYMKHSQDKINKIQKKLAKQVKGSNRRKKTKYKFSKIHEKVANQRLDFQYRVAKHYVDNYGTIIHEDMKNWKSFRSLNRSLRDVSWFQFFDILKNKAAEAGREIIKVNPKNTSQKCSNCGEIVKKDLSVRVHDCPFCKLKLDRDENAALNILRAGAALRKTPLLIPRSPCL